MVLWRHGGVGESRRCTWTSNTCMHARRCQPATRGVAVVGVVVGYRVDVLEGAVPHTQ